jgi:hypothetical protein
LSQAFQHRPGHSSMPTWRPQQAGEAQPGALIIARCKSERWFDRGGHTNGVCAGAGGSATPFSPRKTERKRYCRSPTTVRQLLYATTFSPAWKGHSAAPVRESLKLLKSNQPPAPSPTTLAFSILLAHRPELGFAASSRPSARAPAPHRVRNKFPGAADYGTRGAGAASTT